MTQTLTARSASHLREHKSVTAAAEKRLLVWIARHLPHSIHSDHLSALGLTAMGAAGVSFALFDVSPAVAAAGLTASLAANWFGDSLDGTVARVRDQQRPRYGFYVDHVIDIAGSALLLGGLAASSLMSTTVALALLVAYLLVSAESYLATHAAGVFRMSFLGFGPTELRLLLIAGAIRAAISPEVTVAVIGPVRLFDIGGAIAIAGMLVAFIASSVRNTRALYLAEPIDRGRSRAA
jgi:phosphatidylglycerophosphate synthase